MAQKIIGRYIVTDPRICHGQPTFRGTRIMVRQVLEQAASGMAWETIMEEWRGSVSKEAIAEAVRLAMWAFVEHADEYRGTSGHAGVASPNHRNVPQPPLGAFVVEGHSLRYTLGREDLRADLAGRPNSSHRRT